jgi:hypothetical protein
MRIQKLLNANPGLGMEKIRIRDPGWKHSDLESGINIIRNTGLNVALTHVAGELLAVSDSAEI